MRLEPLIAKKFEMKGSEKSRQSLLDECMRFKPLPIGVDDFEKIREQGYYYADKTLLIKELLENIYTAGEAPKVVNIEEQLCSFKWKRVFEMERKRQYKSRVGKMPWNVICLKREG